MKITDYIDINKVANDMLQAVGISLNRDIPDTVQFGTGAVQDYITNIAQIQADAATGAISKEEADELMIDAAINLRMAAQTALGLEKITAQNAINAAIGVLNAAINAAIGAAVKSIPLIPI
jgi:hypothetical protein